MIKVLCTLRFTEEQLDKLRAVSPRLAVEQRACHDAEEVGGVLIIHHHLLPLDRQIQRFSGGFGNLPRATMIY